MKAVRVNEFGPPEVLVAEELPEPRAGGGRVVVNIGAIGVNFGEARLRAGAFAEPAGQRPPFVPGNEVGGVVAEVGPGVDATLAGRRVVPGPGGRGAHGACARRSGLAWTPRWSAGGSSQAPAAGALTPSEWPSPRRA